MAENRKRFGKTVKTRRLKHKAELVLEQNEKEPADEKSGNKRNSRISRRDFLKSGAVAAAVAVGSATVLGKLPLPKQEPGTPATPVNNSSEPIVATVSGDQVTVMNGQTVVKTRDIVLASMIAGKVNTGD